MGFDGTLQTEAVSTLDLIHYRLVVFYICLPSSLPLLVQTQINVPKFNTHLPNM